MKKTLSPSKESAETLAIQALGFLAADEDRLLAFLGLTGIGMDEIRDRAADSAFLAGVLDYLLQDEPTLLEFAEAQAIRPEMILTLRRALPGATEW